jgi:uncharacterized membrane protein (DUF106 family)
MPEPAPLPSGAEEAAPTKTDAPLATASTDDGEEEEETPSAKPATPPVPAFKFSTFILTFLFLMGLLMIFDSNLRIQVAGSVFGIALWPLLGFSGQFPLLTMCLAAVLEMLATAVAYNWATDWVKAAKVQKWSSAFRKVQMAAMRSGRKDRIEALQPHQQKLTQLSSDVSLAQLKGMAVTWFLVIAVYTWVYVFLDGYCSAPIQAGLSGCKSVVHTGSQVNVVISGAPVGLVHSYWIIPLWFVLFTFYTVPFSLLFRRILKHLTLRRYAEELAARPGEASATGGSA